MSKPKNHFLRHTLATIAYRFQNATHQTPDDFGDFSPGQGTRTVSEIINHMYQLLRSSGMLIDEGTFSSKPAKKLKYLPEIERFSKELVEFDRILIKEDFDLPTAYRLLKGPLSDILTHIGQIAMIRRLDGNPVKRGGYSSAPIAIGQFSYF
jgi:hypothetical protein